MQMTSYCWQRANEQAYCKFVQEYENYSGSTYKVTRITAKEIYEEFKNSTDIQKDTLATLTRLYSGSEVENSTTKINNLKRLIKWDSDISNTAVIILTGGLNGTYGNDGVVSANETMSGDHSLLIVGWIYSDGKLYWICHNSWGKSNGDNGKLYIPVDYSGIIEYYQASGLSASRPENWVWCTDLSGMEISGVGSISGAFDLNSGKRYLNLNAANEKPAFLSATEWNMFCMRINEFRYYKGFEKYSFDTVAEDYVLSAERFNAAVNATADMSAYISGEIPDTVVSGAFIYKSNLDALAAALNGIV